MQTFADLLPNTENPVMASVLLLLSWVACADGKVDETELESLQQIAGNTVDSVLLKSILGVARAGKVADLQLACEIIQQIDPDRRKLVLKMAIGMSLEDGVLTAAESHIIRLIADIALVSPRMLDSYFEEMTGRKFPPASDLSDPEWWSEAESRRFRRGEARDGEDQSAKHHVVERLKDLATLGLDDGATQEEIKAAYRRIAHIHHPDKFSSLGAEAVGAAEVSFRRIQSAYERLMKS